MDLAVAAQRNEPVNRPSNLLQLERTHGKRRCFPLASDPYDTAAMFLEQLLPLTSVTTSIMFRKAWTYLTEKSRRGIGY